MLGFSCPDFNPENAAAIADNCTQALGPVTGRIGPEIRPRPGPEDRRPPVALAGPPARLPGRPRLQFRGNSVSLSAGSAIDEGLNMDIGAIGLFALGWLVVAVVVSLMLGAFLRRAHATTSDHDVEVMAERQRVVRYMRKPRTKATRSTVAETVTIDDEQIIAANSKQG